VLCKERYETVSIGILDDQKALISLCWSLYSVHRVVAAAEYSIGVLFIQVVQLVKLCRLFLCISIIYDGVLVFTASLRQIDLNGIITAVSETALGKQRSAEIILHSVGLIVYGFFDAHDIAGFFVRYKGTIGGPVMVRTVIKLRIIFVRKESAANVYRSVAIFLDIIEE